MGSTFALDGSEVAEFDHQEYSVRTARARFDAKIRVEPNGCWRWIGAFNSDGYGVFLFRGKLVRAHRWAYFYFRGSMPEGLVPDHKCRNRWCTNPWHLEIVTRRTNTMRGDTIPAANWNKKVCLRGHEFDAISRSEKNGHVYYARRCQTCAREQRRERDRVLGRSSRS